MSDLLKKRDLYDFDAPNKSTGIINGNASNVLNWDDIAYPWSRKRYTTMKSNFWIPSEIDMSADKIQWSKLTEDERDTYKKIKGLLALLDSIQTDYAGRAADYLTDPAVNACMIMLAQQEVIHNESYTYNLSSLINNKEQDEVFNYWRTDEVLKKRNLFILEGYSAFAKEQSIDNFIKSIVFDVVLEGLFFYSGFAFFYNLARQGKMMGTAKMINYINRDEQIHVGLFVDIFKTVLNENPSYKNEELEKFVIETFTKAAELEIEWAEYVIGNKIDGINSKEISNYIKFYSNFRVQQLGYGRERVFPGYNKNPLRWIKAYEDETMGKTDYFETENINYKKTSADNGFDDL